MYFNDGTGLYIVLAQAVTTRQLNWVASYNEITSSGMTLPQTAVEGLTNSMTQVAMLTGVSGANIQLAHLSVYNDDSVASTVEIYKDNGGVQLYTLVQVLLQAGDTLEWSRETGWRVFSNTTQSAIKLTEFTSNGTWTKPVGLKRVLVACVGAGGGGGSGRRDAAGTNRSGGGGGGGGTLVCRNIAADDLTATVAVTVGTGGTGASAITVDTTNGSAGGNGGDTSFGALVIAKGGTGGGGGTSASGGTGTAGNSSACTPAASPYALTGTNGGAGATGNGSNSGAGFNGATAAPGGGGGGGITSANASSTTGGSGGAVIQNGVTINGPTSGAGASNQSRFLFFSSSLSSTNGLGTGGAGGFHTSYPTNKDGGAAGNYGAGGGGGSASVNGSASGAGGAGGGGLCVVMEIY